MEERPGRDGESLKPIPRQKLPSFRRILRPGPSNYERSELGALKTPQVASDAGPASQPAKPVELKRPALRPPSLSDTLASLNLGDPDASKSPGRNGGPPTAKGLANGSTRSFDSATSDGATASGSGNSPHRTKYTPRGAQNTPERAINVSERANNPPETVVTSDVINDASAKSSPRSSRWPERIGERFIDDAVRTLNTPSSPQAKIDFLKARSPMNNEHKIAMLHSKPRFKQVVKSSGATKKDESEAVRDLLDREYPGKIDDFDLKNCRVKDLTIPGLVPKLLPHQVVGVNFLTARERARKYARGGLLADGMGVGKTIQSIGLILHQMPPPEVPAKHGQRTTLVVGPLAVMDQWKEEISRMAPRLRVATHQGSDRTTRAGWFADYDVVITTYNIVAMERKNDGALFKTSWYRIIADEAHAFRNPGSLTAQGMMQLQSNGRRFALTGTPIHNRVGDIITLLRFIGVEDLGPDPSRDQLEHILKAVMLRRTQKVLKGALPAIEMSKQGVKLKKHEMEIYNRFEQGLRRSGGLNVQTLVTLRLACDGIAAPKGTKITQEAIGAGGKDGTADAGESDAEITGKADESDALAAMLSSMSLSKPKNDSKYWGHDNSKVQALKEILLKDKTRKTVVFSSFVTMLHGTKPMLEHEGISYEMYDGSLSASRRQSVLNKFKSPTSSITVLLCSLHAAAVGLNLAEASQVVLIEPWWNPQIADQAIKRVHRLGQKSVVNCVELFAKNVLEERIMIIQDLKRKSANDVLEKSEKLTKEERDFLYYGTTSEEVPEGDLRGDQHSTYEEKTSKDASTELEKESNGGVPSILKSKSDKSKKSGSKKSSSKG